MLIYFYTILCDIHLLWSRLFFQWKGGGLEAINLIGLKLPGGVGLLNPTSQIYACYNHLLTDSVYTYLIQSEAFWKSPSVSDEWKQVTLQNLLVSGRVHYPSKDADWSFPFVRYPCPDIHLKILKSGLTNQLLTLCICAMWVIVCWLAFYFFFKIVDLRFHTNEIIFKLIFFKSKILFLGWKAF